ncbi:MAG: sigma 54-interacting transcriptional regulator, partial [Bacteroidota bacterium]
MQQALLFRGLRGLLKLQKNIIKARDVYPHDSSLPIAAVGVEIFTVVIAVTLALSPVSFAQQFNVVHYSKDKGLPGNQVWSIYQDSKGYMWFSTSPGLVKYNGKEYKVFRGADGLLGDFALNVQEDRKGNLWAGCPGGVSRIRNHKIDNWKLGTFDDFYRVFVDSYDRVWVYNFQFASDLHVIENDSFYNYSQIYRFKNQRILHIDEDKSGGIHLLTQGGKVYKFFANNMTQVLIGEILDQVLPRTFFFDSHGSLILCGDGGVARISFSTRNERPTSEWLLRSSAVFGLESKSGQYWFATRDSGLYRISRQYSPRAATEKQSEASEPLGSNILHITEANGLTTNDLFTLFEDREQNVWVGTNLKGICKLSSLRFIAYGNREGFRSEAILAVARHGGWLYCSTEKGIYRFDGRKFSKPSIRERGKTIHKDRFFLSMTPIGEGEFLLGAAPGLYFLDKHGTLESIGLRRLVVQKFLRDSAGVVWIGTNKGIYKLQDKNTVIRQDFGITNRVVNSLVEVSNRDLYVATDSGLVVIENATLPFVQKSVRVLTTENGLLSNMISDLTVSSEGEIIIGTSEGISVLTKEGSYNIVDGLNDRFVNVLLVDRGGKLWAGTDNGLHLLQKVDGRFRVLVAYFKNDGLVSNEFTRNGTMYEDEQVRIWSGSFGGLTVYDPKEEPSTSIKPRCYLSSVQVNDTAEISIDTLPTELSHTQNKLRFFFEALSFFNEDAVRFEYYLAPLERPWSNATLMPNVSYGYIEPGAYTFYVRATNPFGIVSDPQTVSFTILAPYWERGWFIALVGAVLLVATYQAHRYRLSRISERALLLEKLVSEKTAEVQASKNEIEEQYHRLVRAQEELVEKAKLEKAYEEIQKLKNRLATENIYLKEKQSMVQEVSSIVGRSEAIQQIRNKVVEVASTDSTVLITGETGTGKNLVAEAIHALSARKDRALVTVNCAAIPEGLVESELFGHEKGAFTGANERRLGKFEIADGSTIFLDEIGDMNLAVQAKILNILQDRKFARVGGNQSIEVDVRVIAATNYDP